MNDALFFDPKLWQDVVDILICFRSYHYAFTADICKMYRQILLLLMLPEFCVFQHILWRDSPHDKLVDCKLNTVTYDVNCVPYLALRVLQSIVADDCELFPDVRKALRHHTYVDNIY